MIVAPSRAKPRSKQTQERLQVVKAILGLEPSERQAPLLQALSDKSPYVALMIAQSQQPGAAALLAGAVEQFSGDALRAVVLALATIRGPDACLHRLLKSDREYVRLAVIDALPPDATSQALLKTLAARDSSPPRQSRRQSRASG